ncbi:hypothetical protein AVEN_160143-1 [Araneus ventricosus]|uniref:Uncharacterized protein n=1 Tax=Araneus ventricosus TaxID=182803 RepID=A0A4Y2NHB5_ARAVE|nr:hypothetical protein AVEN_160143-1 [Araneus ventricosus]
MPRMPFRWSPHVSDDDIGRAKNHIMTTYSLYATVDRQCPPSTKATDVWERNLNCHSTIGDSAVSRVRGRVSQKIFKMHTFFFTKQRS